MVIVVYGSVCNSETVGSKATSGCDSYLGKYELSLQLNNHKGGGAGIKAVGY